jgi:hypothetical protein
MVNISRRRVCRYFERGNNSSTAHEQGRALEDLICYLIGAIPGIELIKRNVFNAFGTEQVDVAFWNNQSPDGLFFLPHILLVECKNWSKPVGSQQVSYFANLLQHRSSDHGILVAANGITGVAEDLTRAHYEIAMSLAQGRRILIVTRSELEAARNTQQLVRLLKGKLCELTVSGTLFR